MTAKVSDDPDLGRVPRRAGTTLRRARALIDGVYAGYPRHQLHNAGDEFIVEHDPTLTPSNAYELLDAEPGAPDAA